MTRRIFTPRTKEHIHAALSESDRLWLSGELSGAWSLLERAHVLSQPWMLPHLKVHWRMLRFASAQRDVREILGQVIRLVLVVPGTLLDRLPTGNTGGSNVSPFVPMPVSQEIEEIMKGREGE
jgi:hypothetical protein